MSFLTINLEDESGGVIESIQDNGLLGKYIPEANDKNYCCAKYINRWGNTIFNELQMDDLIKELVSRTSKSEDKEIQMLIVQIYNLVEIAKKDVHVYIKFIGD